MIQACSFTELIRKFIEDGFTFACLSNVTGAPMESLKRLYDGDLMSIEERKEIDYAMVFLQLLYMENIEYEGYLESIVEILKEQFEVSHEAIAAYLGLTMKQFYSFIIKPEAHDNSYSLTKRLLHLYTTFLRDKKFSYE